MKYASIVRVDKVFGVHQGSVRACFGRVNLETFAQIREQLLLLLSEVT